MKRIFLSAAVIISCIAAQAQVVNGGAFLKAADKYYQKGDFYSAAKYYEKYLGLDGQQKKAVFDPYAVNSKASGNKKNGSKELQDAAYKLADSYRQLHYYVKAAPVYEKVVQFDKEKYPLSQYYYAITQRALGKYAEAEKSFQSFLDGYKKQDAFTQSALQEVQNLRYIQQQLSRADLDQFKLTKVTSSSENGANYAPVWSAENTLLFTSTRKDNKQAKVLNNVYQANYTNQALSDITALPIAADQKMHQGVLALSPDGTKLYLTRWTIEGAERHAAIYLSRKIDNQWTEPVKLDETINMPGFNTQQPFVMPGGRQLIFASNRTGGVGGFDLWTATLDETGIPSAPKNMGKVINTERDEQAPYFHPASQTLVFASNGFVGMGGFDLFASKQKAGSWKEPVNLGNPVNSIKDDLYFATQSKSKNVLENVLISSDRQSDCCLDLFQLSRTLPDITIEGKVVGCDGQRPLEGAVVTIQDQEGKTLTTVSTDAAGQYQVKMKEFNTVKASAQLNGYKESSLKIESPEDAETLVLNNAAICLENLPPAVNESIVIPNVYYRFNETELTTDSYPSLDSLVNLMAKYSSMKVEISAHTDNIGSKASNQKISAKRASNVVAYLVGKGIDASRLEAKGFGYSKPVAPNKNADGSDNPKGRELNRRTEMKVLSY